MEDFQEFATNTFTTAIVESFSQLGVALGNALSGAEDPIGGFFKGIAATLADSLVTLGKYVIESSLLISTIGKSLNAALKGNPALGILAGVALVAIGQALKNNIPKFADGVTNFGGGVALVGERGPELVRLPQGSDVIPNYQLNNMQGGSGMQVIIPSITLRGQDMVVAFNRANQTISRNG